MTGSREEYQRRIDAAIRGEPTCGVRGRDHAECVLEPNHDGAHEGNGFDEWGELYRCWERRPVERRSPRTTATTTRTTMTLDDDGEGA